MSTLANVLYDPREGAKRDNVPTAQTALWWSGVMHYVELDVNNLRRWLRSDIGTAGRAACINGAGTATCPMDVTGFVVYFSDRRSNRNLGADNVRNGPTWDVGTATWVFGDDQETGDFGWEDNINTDANSTPNNQLDPSVRRRAGREPLVGRRQPERYASARTGSEREPAAGCRVVSAGGRPLLGATPLPANTTCGTRRSIGASRDVNRAFFFRRALKLVNGGRGSAGQRLAGADGRGREPGLRRGQLQRVHERLAELEPQRAEPGVHGRRWLRRHPGVDHVSAAVISDAVTLLSNAWSDIRSFESRITPGRTVPPLRPSVTP